MTNLINGYVWAVSEHLPHDMPRDMRRDVAAELRASIADMVEERGDDSAEATRDVLVELGDPPYWPAGTPARSDT